MIYFCLFFMQLTLNPLTTMQAEAISYSQFSLTATAWPTLDNENQKTQYLQSGR